MKLEPPYLLGFIRKVLVRHTAINTKSKQQHKWNVPRNSERN